MTLRRRAGLRALVAASAAALALTACGGPDNPVPGPAPSAPAAAPLTSAAADTGVTTDAEVFGPACAQLPQSALAAMGGQPVATAAASSPLLTTLVSAVKAVPGLPETLDHTQGITVFAPADDAFAAVQRPTVQALFKDTNKLGALLAYHVVGTRYDAQGLVAAGQTTELAGGTLTIGGTPDAPTVTDGQGSTAQVLCGNIPTANATVFVIDRVLMPKG